MLRALCSKWRQLLANSATQFNSCRRKTFTKMQARLNMIKTIDSQLLSGTSNLHLLRTNKKKSNWTSVVGHQAVSCKNVFHNSKRAFIKWHHR